MAVGQRNKENDSAKREKWKSRKKLEKDIARSAEKINLLKMLPPPSNVPVPLK